MPRELMKLGDFSFSLDTAAPARTRRSDRWRWETLPRIGREPALQYVGPGVSEIELDGVIYPHYRGGLGQVDAMRAEAARGAPLRLVTGEGANLGLWCITGIRETGSYPIAGGSPRKIEFELSLRRYGDDDDDGTEERA